MFSVNMLKQLFVKWWFYLPAGFLFGLISPPYNHELNWFLLPVPLLSIPLLTPLIYSALRFRGKKRFFTLWLWGIAAIFSRSMWLVNVTIEGKWIYVVFALFLLSLFLGIAFALAGYLAALSRRFFGKFWILIYPSLWVLLDYVKSTGELSFPWLLQGYLFTPFLPFAQLGAVTGLWGLTWIAVFASLLFYIRFADRKPLIKVEVALLIFITAVSLWGAVRLKRAQVEEKFKVALIQSNLDHKNWDKETSLDEAMELNEEMIQSVEDSAVDLIVLPESGVYAYLDYSWVRKKEVFRWARESNTPIMLGTLDYTVREKPDSGYDIYNSAFMIRPDQLRFEKYRKMKLVPVSEGMPYGWKFPLLSRIKIPGGSFQRGFENVTWDIDSSFSIVPTICYEAIYPGFNRDRLLDGGDATVNITNDSWFGISKGPYQHLEMARFRAIETGVPVIRCAASGISVVTDCYGRYLAKTTLGERATLVSSVPKKLSPTIYMRFGDWFIWVNILMVIFASVISVIRGRKGLSQN